MDLTVSRPVRILALAGLVLALVGGGVTMLLRPSGSEPVAVPPPAPPSPQAPATAGTGKPGAAATKPASPAAAAAKAKARAKAHAAPTRHAAPARHGNLVDARLPAPLQWALSRHRVVVVALYDPHAEVDSIAVAEAHAGAVRAKAGFLLVNVLDNKVAGLLTGLLPSGGLLPDPGVLVYRAPGTLAFRLDGFNDRDAVAQAAANAAAGQSDASGAGTS